MKKIEKQAGANSGAGPAGITAETAAELHLIDLSDIRRSRLEVLIEQAFNGSAAEFSDRTGFSTTQVSQFLSTTYNGGKSIGERAARNIEAKSGLQFGWLDQAGSDAQIGASLVPAKAGTPELHPGDVYAGITTGADGAPYHLILLPGDARVTSIDEAENFAMSLGGELPTYAELTILCKRMQDQFQPSLYYTCEKEPYDGDMAAMLFDATPVGELRNDVHQVRARSVHRLPADDNAVDFATIKSEQRQITTEAAHRCVIAGAERSLGVHAFAISATQVAQMACRLINEASSEDESCTNDEHLVQAGIKMGIAKMAMEVQAVLVAFGRKVDDHAEG